MSLQTDYDMVKVSSSMPNFFICPISLNLMQDPVTLCTGETYDRRSIENWFDQGFYSCPSTMQRLSTLDVVPNHLLRGMIYDWSASSRRNIFTGANEVSPSPGIPEPCNVRMMLTDLAESANGSIKILKALQAMAKVSYSETKVLSEARNVNALCNFLFSSVNMSNNVAACEEALSLLVLLPVDSVRNQIAIRPKTLSVLSWFLCKGGLNARANAALLLASLVSKEAINDRDEELKLSIGTTIGVFEGLVELLKEESHCGAVPAALKACLSILSIERNIVKGVEAGLAFIIIELLVKLKGKNLQRAFKLLEYVCSTAEGLAVVSSHALTIPVLARFIVRRESNRITRKSISSLWIVCNQSGQNGERCREEARAQGLLEHLLHISRQDMSNDDFKVTERATYLRALLWCRSTGHLQAR